MKCIEGLKARLSDKNSLYVQNEDGYLGEAGFVWNEAATSGEIKKFEDRNNIILPRSYKEFLKISNGAILFREDKYSQWGCNILGLEDIESSTRDVKELGYRLDPSWVVFAKWLGDGDVLLFDLSKYNAGIKNFIMDGDQDYQTDEWGYINGDFGQWVDRLIVAQGAKYWRWY